MSLPAFAQRVTVLGSTRNIVATSAGVKSGSASGVRVLAKRSSFLADRRMSVLYIRVGGAGPSTFKVGG